MNELTREQILSMPAGRELNRLIAIKIMGYEDAPHHEGYVKKNGLITSPKRYSSDIAAAWEVVDKFETIEIKRFHTDKGLWFCEIKDKIWHRSYGTTAPEAICKAALLAVMGL